MASGVIKDKNKYAREYYLRNKDSLKVKHRSNSRAYYHRHRTKCLKKSKLWRINNPKKHSNYMVKRNKDLKRFAIDLYGGKCSCCGESDIRFLTLDHINSDGRKDPMGRGNALYSALRNCKKRKDLQVLCFNCNCGRQINGGICPHKEIW